MVEMDPNTLFVDLHEKFRKGAISREEHDRRLRVILILTGKVPAPVNANSIKRTPEHSGSLFYNWGPDGTLSIAMKESWALAGQGRLNGFPRHVRQTARMELNDTMTEAEAVKLRTARAANDTLFEAVMDDLRCNRAEDIVQKQGPDTKRAVNLDERFNLGDNPDLIQHEDLDLFIDGPARRAIQDMER